MLNYRLVALLILLTCVVSPLAFQWIIEPVGSWLRPYLAWLLLIAAAFLISRRAKRSGNNP